MDAPRSALTATLLAASTELLIATMDSPRCPQTLTAATGETAVTAAVNTFINGKNHMTKNHSAKEKQGINKKDGCFNAWNKRRKSDRISMIEHEEMLLVKLTMRRRNEEWFSRELFLFVCKV